MGGYARGIELRAGAALLTAVACLILPGCGALQAARILEDAQRPAADLAADVEGHQGRLQGVPVVTYRPRGAEGPLPSLVLVHGADPDGYRHERLVALARAIAKRGVSVTTPDLELLRRYRIDASSPSRLASVARRVADDRERSAGGRTALMGISVGGSTCLVAATDERLAGRLTAVLSFGGYADLEVLLRHWMVRSKKSFPGSYDRVLQVRRRVLRGNVDRLADARDRAEAARALRAVLRGRRPAAPDALGGRARRLVAAARATGPLAPGVANSLIRPLRRNLVALSPVRQPRVPSVPIYLLHALADPVVPASDSARLESFFADRGADVTVHVTDMLGHTEQKPRPGLFRAWPLLRFLARFLSAVGT